MSKELRTVCERERTPLLLILLTVAMAFLPLSSVGNVIRMAILLIQIILSGRVVKIPHGMKKVFVGMITSLILPLIFVYLIEGGIVFSVWFHEAIRIVFNIVLIVVISRFRIPFRWLRYTFILLLAFNTTIQILQYAGVEAISSWIRQFYLVEGSSDIHLLLAETTAGFRSGSIYLNPNVYMVIPLITLGVLLQSNIFMKSITNYFWIMVCFVSLVLTGSRTTLVVAGAITVLFFLKFDNSRPGKWIILAIIALLLASNWSVLTEEFRVFNLSEGMSDSFRVKLEGLFAYIKNANVIYYITGSLSSVMNVQIDAEWGYIFKFYGVIGLWWYINMIKRMRYNYYVTPFLTVEAITVVCLVGMSATVMLCMAIFPVVCLVVYPEIEVEG